jgi:hypothetical protein
LTRRSESRPRASAVRRTDRFRRISQRGASCGVASGRDGAGSGSVFWRKPLQSHLPGAILCLWRRSRAPEADHLGKIGLNFFNSAWIRLQASGEGDPSSVRRRANAASGPICFSSCDAFSRTWKSSASRSVMRPAIVTSVSAARWSCSFKKGTASCGFAARFLIACVAASRPFTSFFQRRSSRPSGMLQSNIVPSWLPEARILLSGEKATQATVSDVCPSGLTSICPESASHTCRPESPSL